MDSDFLYILAVYFHRMFLFTNCCHNVFHINSSSNVLMPCNCVLIDFYFSYLL